MKMKKVQKIGIFVQLLYKLEKKLYKGSNPVIATVPAVFCENLCTNFKIAETIEISTFSGIFCTNVQLFPLRKSKKKKTIYIKVLKGIVFLYICTKTHFHK